MELHMTVNGEEVVYQVNEKDMLLDVLRDDLGLTGTKKGCGKGECGACTVILNGKAVNSCMIPVGKAEGGVVETVEGLAGKNGLHPLQQAFIDSGAVQCGFCTPGMLMSAKALLDECPKPNEEQIKEAIGGNICRCTGYVKIVRAIELAAERMTSSKEDEE